MKKAKLIENAGAFSIVLECLTSNAAKLVTDNISIPTIGIGSSSYCDGQILVTDDMLGLSGFYPKFVKKYVNLNRTIEKATKKYTRDVKQNKFPSKKNFLNGPKLRYTRTDFKEIPLFCKKKQNKIIFLIILILVTFVSVNYF